MNMIIEKKMSELGREADDIKKPVEVLKIVEVEKIVEKPVEVIKVVEKIVEAPKVVVSAGDQPGEMSKYTPYSAKGESYRLDPICGDIEDALQQSRAKKKQTGRKQLSISTVGMHKFTDARKTRTS